MPGCMRYPDSGGVSAQGRVRREMVRLQAVQMFQQEVRPVQVAQWLRVSMMLAYQVAAVLAGLTLEPGSPSNPNRRKNQTQA